jgi:YfiR/HmsC-like
MAVKFQLLSKFRHVLRAIIAVLGMLCYTSPLAFADEEMERENKIKMAYLFHFSQFTEWVVKSPHFNYCVYDDIYFSKLLKESYVDKTLNGAEINVLSINDDSNVTTCQLIFFPNIAPQEILNKISRKPILSVGIQKNFIAQNGIIYLYEKDQKIRFYINNNVATEVGLKISSQLLSLSKDATQ